MKTVKIETKNTARSRYDAETIENERKKGGRYNAVDESTVPKIVDIRLVQEKVLQPVRKPVQEQAISATAIFNRIPLFFAG